MPKEILLEYKLVSGWEPLYQILGKDIPKVPLPHLNESPNSREMVLEVAMKALKNHVISFVLLSVFVVVPVFVLTF